MSCEDMKILISGLIDGELDSSQKKTIEDHIVSCHVCRSEYSKLMKIKEATNSMKYFDLPDRLWDGYWHGIYRRLERGTGWILLSIGALILVAFGLWRLLNDFFLDPAVSIILRAGVGALLLGLLIILISIIRERLFARKHDRYDEVQI